MLHAGAIIASGNPNAVIRSEEVAEIYLGIGSMPKSLPEIDGLDAFYRAQHPRLFVAGRAPAMAKDSPEDAELWRRKTAHIAPQRIIASWLCGRRCAHDLSCTAQLAPWACARCNPRLDRSGPRLGVDFVPSSGSTSWSPLVRVWWVRSFISKARISPDAAFSVLDCAAYMIFIVVIGGIGTLEGPIIGIIIFDLMQAYLAGFGAGTQSCWALLQLRPSCLRRKGSGGIFV
jgi:hypothetical protein